MAMTIDPSPDRVDRDEELRELGIDPEVLVQEALTVRRNKAALLRFQKEVFNGHDWSTETLGRHLAADFVDHAAMPGDPPGFEGVQMRFGAWAAAFDDAEEENIEMVGEGDMVAVLYTLRAVNRGDFMGIRATNSPVAIPGIEFLRFRDGRIAEHWGIYDFMSTAEELGAAMTFVPLADWKAARRPEHSWGPALVDPAERPAAKADAPGVRAMPNRRRRDGGHPSAGR